MIRWPSTLPPTRDDGVDIVVFGENSLDFVGVGPRLPHADKTSLSSFSQFVGGQGATAAVGCARQGWRTRYIGSFGDDPAAATVQARLRDEDVDVIALTRHGVGSRVAMILVDESNGERAVFEFRPPALRIDAGEISPRLVTSARVLLVDATHPDAAIALAEIARAAAMPVLVDIDRPIPQAARLLSLVDLLVVPESFARVWTGESGPEGALAALVREFRAPVTIVTLGANGSLAAVGGATIHTPGFMTEVVDTTGAGDAFRAGLVSGWLSQPGDAGAEAILAHANATAALNCGALGAQAALPGRAAVDALVTRRRHGQSK